MWQNQWITKVITIAPAGNVNVRVIHPKVASKFHFSPPPRVVRVITQARVFLQHVAHSEVYSTATVASPFCFGKPA